METTPLSQEERVKMLHSKWYPQVCDTARKYNDLANGASKVNSQLLLIIMEAIQFGSLLTIERAKEKINKFSEWNAPFTGMANKEDVLKAIEESKI